MSVTSAFASDYKSAGFTFISVHPGWLKTDMGGQAAPLEVSEGASGVYNVRSFFFEFLWNRSYLITRSSRMPTRLKTGNISRLTVPSLPGDLHYN